ncbi:unnamed protein product [Sphagnum tenellum]
MTERRVIVLSSEENRASEQDMSPILGKRSSCNKCRAMSLENEEDGVEELEARTIALHVSLELCARKGRRVLTGQQRTGF